MSKKEIPIDVYKSLDKSSQNGSIIAREIRAIDRCAPDTCFLFCIHTCAVSIHMRAYK